MFEAGEGGGDVVDDVLGDDAGHVGRVVEGREFAPQALFHFGGELTGAPPELLCRSREKLAGRGIHKDDGTPPGPPSQTGGGAWTARVAGPGASDRPCGVFRGVGRAWARLRRVPAPPRSCSPPAARTLAPPLPRSRGVSRPGVSPGPGCLPARAAPPGSAGAAR
ncbi:hypothetical protein GCM10010378_32540 [Streptomyces viridochromogenes]